MFHYLIPLPPLLQFGADSQVKNLRSVCDGFLLTLSAQEGNFAEASSRRLLDLFAVGPK